MKMRKLVRLATIFLLLGVSAWGQEIRHEITIQGSGFVGRETTDHGLSSKPTNSGGFMAGYRYSLNRWLSVEGDYDYFRNSQTFLSASTITRVPTNTHAVTGSAVVTLPMVYRLSPFVVAGGGVMMFDPRDNASIDTQTRGTFVYGGGADMKVMRHVAVRAQYRGFVYKSPDFDVHALNVDKVTHSAVPSVGFVVSF